MSVLKKNPPNSAWEQTRNEIDIEEKNLRETFGNQLYKLCENINQSELASTVFGQERQYISDMISGKKALNLAKIKRLAEYFNVPIDFFFYDDFPPTKNVTEQEICKVMHLSKTSLDRWLDLFWIYMDEEDCREGKTLEQEEKEYIYDTSKRLNKIIENYDAFAVLDELAMMVSLCDYYEETVNKKINSPSYELGDLFSLECLFVDRIDANLYRISEKILDIAKNEKKRFEQINKTAENKYFAQKEAHISKTKELSDEELEYLLLKFPKNMARINALHEDDIEKYINICNQQAEKEV